MNKSTQQPTKKTFWNRFSTNTLVPFLLFIACGWVLVKLFWYFKNVFFIFTLAAILALLLNYPILAGSIASLINSQHRHFFSFRTFSYPILISASCDYGNF